LHRAEAAGDNAWQAPTLFAVAGPDWIVYGDALRHVDDRIGPFPAEEVLAAGPDDPPAAHDLPQDDLSYAWLVAHRCYAHVRLP
jgi:hypothetical protein